MSKRLIIAFLSLALLAAAAACGTAGSGVRPGAGTVATPAGPRPASLLLTPQATPAPVVFPRDDGAHDELTEWWYYTGHLWSDDGREFGFEFVIFQSNRAGYPVFYASHFAITDVAGDNFHFTDHGSIGAQPQTGNALALDVSGWTLSITGDRARMHADMPGYALDLEVAGTKPPALHNGTGYYVYGPGTGSYYYSRTRMDATGTLTIDGQPLSVQGQAWMDHQWGNFIVGARGGWNWYSIQLDDNSEIMLWQSRDPEGRIFFAAGTVVRPDGSTQDLSETDFQVTPTGTWTSPHTGAIYPSGWHVTVPSEGLALDIQPEVRDQELYDLQSTGFAYWEGAVRISGTHSGQGYVELTGYAPSP